MSINKQIAVFVTTNTKSIEEGAWVDLKNFSDEENFLKYCKKLHQDEKEPEFIFQYFQGFPEAYYGESKLDPDLWGYLERIKTHDKEIIDTLIENFYSFDQEYYLIDYSRNYFVIDNTRNSVYKAIAYHHLFNLAHDLYECSIPDHLLNYVDYEKFGRDLCNERTFLECNDVIIEIIGS